MGDFDQILMSWLGTYPKGQVPIESAARIEAFNILFTRFKEAGFPKEYFTNQVRARIVTECINPNHPNKRKKRTWIEYVSKHIKITLHTVYDDAVPQEFDPLNAPIVSEKDMEADVDQELSEYSKTKEEIPVINRTNPDEFISKTGTNNSTNFDPEMAELLGLKIK